MHWELEVALAYLIEKGEVSGMGLLALGTADSLGWIVLQGPILGAVGCCSAFLAPTRLMPGAPSIPQL